MSQVSVVQYNMSPQKLNILQQNTNTNYTKPDDRQIIILRKPPPILPQPKNYSKDDILITNPGRKGIKKTGGKDLKTNPQPIAVARRNARERNRVKQVNNGFANLRQHIPNFIAQAFETNNGRGNKKLSKVETLRMAVEYIRSLEEILTMDEDHLTGSGVREKSDMAACPSPISSISQNDSNISQNDLTYNFAMSPSEEDDDDFSSVTTSSPQQYIRINTSDNTYEIIPSNLYENSENMDPMSVEQHHHLLTDTHLLDAGLDLNNQNLQYIQVNSSSSLSPGMYSEGSLSPNHDFSKLSENTQQNCFIPVFATGRLGENFNVHVKTEKDELPVISLKAESSETGSQDGLDVISWWEQSQVRQSSS